MVLVASLLYLARARIALSTIFALTYLLFPRFASWQIDSLRYASMSISPLDWAISLEMDVGVSVFNPNHVPARLHNATLDIYRVRPTYISGMHQAPTYGRKFGVATASAHDIPRRDSFPLDSHISIVRLPFSVACSFLREMATNEGLIKVRGVGQALVSAAAQDVTVFVDCLQHVKPFPHPGRIVHTACTYTIANGGGANGALLDLLQLQLGPGWGKTRRGTRHEGQDQQHVLGSGSNSSSGKGGGIEGEMMLKAVVAAAQASEGL
ncbi:Hypothetical protein NocV09_00203710 [Nannochloropsis oceanica]